MSNLPSIIQDTDLTESEIVKVQKYKEDGLPGIGDVTDNDLHRMLDLYLTGSTYTQISNILGVKKIAILYFAQSANWYVMKKEFLNEVQEKHRTRVADAKIRSKDFMLTLVQAWQKRIGGKLNRYLETNDTAHMDEIDLKEVAQLMKAIEMLNELDENGRDSKGKTPAVGLNVGNGVTIEKTGDNKISITPKPTTVGDMLEMYANERREKEKVAIESKPDIIDNTKGVNDESK